jgi:hypothetical protein
LKARATSAGSCNRYPKLEKLFDRQSAEANEGKRKKLVWEIEGKLAEDGARPIIFYNRFAYCWQPPVKGWTMSGLTTVITSDAPMRGAPTRSVASTTSRMA